MASVPTARNSDCQFWSVRSQKFAFARYLPHETVGCSCRGCSSLYSLQPVTDWPNHEAKKITDMTSKSELA
jgi:hypothetical protein